MQLSTIEAWSFGAIAVAAIAFVLLERIAPYDRGQSLVRPGFWVDLALYGFVQSWALGVLIGRLIALLDASTGLSRLALVSQWPLPAQVAFFVVTHDLYIYLMHRAQHASPFLWRFHEAHHSVPQVDWLSGVRSHPVEILVNQTIEFAPIVLLGAAPEVAPIKGAVSAIWGMFIHSNWNVRLGVLRYVLNGPELHRWHHADQPEAYGKNFATKLAALGLALRNGLQPRRRRAEGGAVRPRIRRLPGGLPQPGPARLRPRAVRPRAGERPGSPGGVVSRAWLFLILSGLLQIGWVVSLRQTQGFTRFVPILFFAFFGLTSTVCFAQALKGIPMGVAYAVWTGISVAGSVLVDVIVFREVGLLRLACIVLILLGTSGLKLAGDVGPQPVEAASLPLPTGACSPARRGGSVPP